MSNQTLYILQTKNPRVIKGAYATLEEALEKQKNYEELTGQETTIITETTKNLF